jgi:hypothetical protein
MRFLLNWKASIRSMRPASIQMTGNALRGLSKYLKPQEKHFPGGMKTAWNHRFVADL